LNVLSIDDAALLRHGGLARFGRIFMPHPSIMLAIATFALLAASVAAFVHQFKPTPPAAVRPVIWAGLLLGLASLSAAAGAFKTDAGTSHLQHRCRTLFCVIAQ
jgi:hypothetical protein